MKKLIYLFLFFIFLSPVFADEELSGDDIFDIKQGAYALYNTGHKEETLEALKSIPDDKKDSETYLILSNLKMDEGDKEGALDYLKKAIDKDPEFYKAYYNSGCIFMEMRVYVLAEDNFKKAAKYAKNNPYVYYNLASSQIYQGNYKAAKKNLIKAIYIKNDEKNFYYNLAYVNKKLGKQKEAQKILDFYNSNFINKSGK